MASYDILAQGMIDKTLTGSPKLTHWRYAHRPCTRFAIESLSQPFNTGTAFGQESQILLNRVGDMVYFMYLHVTLPGIVACDATADPSCAGLAGGSTFPVFDKNKVADADEDALIKAGYLNKSGSGAVEVTAEELAEAKNAWRRDKYGARCELSCCTEGDADCPSVTCPELDDVWAHYCNDVGHFLISKAKLLIGGQQVDQLLGTFLFCWEELTGKSGRRLTELTGRRYTRAQLVCDSGEERELYIPLPFWFTLASGAALPLAALAYHGVQLNVEFEALEKLIVVSKPGLIVRNARTTLGLTANDLKADMEVSYVYLDTAEREKFQNSHFEQLIVQTQHYFKTDNKQICRIPLSFNHPTLELIFAVRRQVHEQHNNWANFSGIDGRDPIEKAELLLNTTSRFGKKPAVYWRSVVPFQFHSNIPEHQVYTMVFALSPEQSLEPTGSLNLSRIDNIELVLDMQSALANELYTVMVFSRSWNIMRYREGVAGAAFQ